MPKIPPTPIYVLRRCACLLTKHVFAYTLCHCSVSHNLRHRKTTTHVYVDSIDVYRLFLGPRVPLHCRSLSDRSPLKCGSLPKTRHKSIISAVDLRVKPVDG